MREYPAVDPPTLSITTSYPGAAAEIVQAQITEPIEEAVNTVAGIRTLTSTSREGASQLTAEFSLDTDLDTAASDVRDQSRAPVRNLPPDADPPMLNKADADSNPIFGLALTSDRRSQLELCALRRRCEGAPADRAWHRGSGPARREALRDASVDGPGEARGLRPLAARRARRDPARERRAALGSHRRGIHRAAGQDAVAARHGRGVQRARDQAQPGRHRALPRHRLRRARRAERARRAQESATRRSPACTSSGSRARTRSRSSTVCWRGSIRCARNCRQTSPRR